MKEVQYKEFSWQTHRKNWKLKNPNVCQFELTFKCGLSCNYCYSSCYNKLEYTRKELEAEKVKSILNEVYKAGALWLCFTGGDPLARDDFLDIYSYAKNKGFIITIFTNGYSMKKEIAEYLEKSPPFVIEIALSGGTKGTYEKISGIKGSFVKTLKGINLILERKLPLKIKTQVTKDNLEELPRIREFVERLGLPFRPSTLLHARLNGDVSPCFLRIKPEEFRGLGKRLNSGLEEECKPIVHSSPRKAASLLWGRQSIDNIDNPVNEHNNSFFPCAIGGGDGLHIDPFGNLIPCNCIRNPKIDLLQENLEQARKIILDWVRSRVFTTGPKCKSCSIRNLCHNCPGKALLEKANSEAVVEWFCELAHLIA